MPLKYISDSPLCLKWYSTTVHPLKLSSPSCGKGCLTLQGVAQGFLLTRPLLSPSSQASLGLRGSHVWSCLQGEAPGQQSPGVGSVSLAV